MTKGRLYVHQHSELAGKSADEIRQQLLANPTLYKKILSYCSTVRSSSPYWFARCKELEEMVQQLGAPTLFFTLSAPDLQSNEMFRLINSTKQEFLNEFQECRSRNHLLNTNPLLAAWFFEERFEVFIHKVLLKRFSVIDFWHRVEFQHRGSPHIHGFLWLSDAPSIQNLERLTKEQLRSIIHYFDKIISACSYTFGQQTETKGVNPCRFHFSQVEDMYRDTGSRLAKHLIDYSKLINKVQIHTTCTKNCLRKNRSTKKLVCRYKFPKELAKKSKFIINEKGKLELQLKRNHPRINQHIPFVTAHWRGNTDFSPIISTETVLYYLAKYASKTESASKNYQELQDLLNIQTGNRTGIGFIQSLLCRQIAVRDYSIQECIWILMGFSFYKTSRSFVKLTLNSDENFIPINDHRNFENEYAKRMETVTEREKELVKNMSMFNFFSTYYRRTSTTIIWSKYRKRPILRIFPKFSTKTKPEQFCKQQVLLHVPWRENFEKTLNPTNLPWTQVYQTHREQIPGYLDFEEITLEEDELEEEKDSRDRAEMDLHEWMIYLREIPGSDDQQAAELGLREQDTQFDWSATYANYPNISQLKTYVSKLLEEQIAKEIYTMPRVSLSNHQNKVLNVVRAQVHFSKTGEKQNEFRQSIIIQGPAGSGKSTLIQGIKAVCNESLGSDSFLILAPTGSAASNINGKTIHSGLKISVRKELNPLQTITLQKLQDALRNCKFIIIDEMSLIGCALFRKIDLRLKQIFNNLEPFGGRFLILLGDLKQLPPVLDRAFYGDNYKNQHSEVGQQLFRQIESSIILPTSFRQNENQLRFRQLLDRLANGETTVEDWKLLNKRVLNDLETNEQSLFENCIRLYDTCEKANEHNLQKLREFEHVYRIPSINNCKQAEQEKAKNAENLEPILYLAIG